MQTNTALLYHQGLKNNWKQFWLLVVVNAFVGSMVGLERSIIPELGESVYHITGKAALLSFIIAFGSSKALFNIITGKLTKHLSRKKSTGYWLAGGLACSIFTDGCTQLELGNPCQYFVRY